MSSIGIVLSSNMIPRMFSALVTFDISISIPSHIGVPWLLDSHDAAVIGKVVVTGQIELDTQ